MSPNTLVAAIHSTRSCALMHTVLVAISDSQLALIGEHRKMVANSKAKNQHSVYAPIPYETKRKVFEVKMRL